MLHARLAENTGRRKSPSRHHHTTLSGHVFATKAMSTIRKKNLLNANTSSTCPHNMVNFGPITAENCWRVWGTPANFNGFGGFTARYSSSGRQPNFAALNRGRHLYWAGRPSHWALAHISSSLIFLCRDVLEFITLPYHGVSIVQNSQH